MWTNLSHLTVLPYEGKKNYSIVDRQPFRLLYVSHPIWIIIARNRHIADSVTLGNGEGPSSREKVLHWQTVCGTIGLLQQQSYNNCKIQHENTVWSLVFIYVWCANHITSEFMDIAVCTTHQPSTLTPLEMQFGMESTHCQNSHLYGHGHPCLTDPLVNHTCTLGGGVTSFCHTTPHLFCQNFPQLPLICCQVLNLSLWPSTVFWNSL
jgi:hypothetical protein